MVRFTPRELPTFVSGTAQSIEYYIRTLARLLFGYHETSPVIDKSAPAIQCQLGVER
jgi:hypothetical protein